MTAIEAAKRLDTLHSLILIMGDMDAKKVLIAWTLYGAKCKDITLKGNAGFERLTASAKSMLEMVWETVEVDFERLSVLAGIPFATTMQIFQRLKEARIIFPDGTATDNAMVIVKSDVGAYLKALPKIK